MIREIKFRALYCPEKCWHYFTLIDLIIGRASKESLQYENWCEYTGLEDKNGKEIYEGDIIQINKDIYEVFWDGRWAEFACKCTSNSLGWYHRGPEKVEIIGNIYENPDLVPNNNEEVV